jgi:hypothetical protein
MRLVMPTPPPDPVPPPKSDLERDARENAMVFMTEILAALHNITYGTRSHVPGGNDCTDFFGALNKVKKWIDERPDWNLEIIKHAYKKIEFPLLEWVAQDQPETAKKLARPIG